MTSNDHTSLNLLASQVVALAKACGATIVTAETCTAGAMSTIIATTPGAGDVLQGGIVAYSKTCKTVLLRLPPALIEKSAVTEDVARAMAEGALRVCSCANTAVAVTCVSGPEPDEDGNPVGLAYIAVSTRGGASFSKPLHLPPQSGGQVRGDVVRCCLELLVDALQTQTPMQT